jgi:hypothetical protein
MDQMKVLTSRLDSVTATRATRAGPDPAAVERLLVAIAQAVGEGYEWTVGELLDHAWLPGKDALLDAIKDVVGADCSPKRMGKLLRAHVGIVMADLTVRRTRHDREGAHWRIVTMR